MRISHNGPFQVLYVGLMNSFEAISLDQLNDTAKTGLHISRQGFELIPNAIIKQLYNPSHSAYIIAFLQCQAESGA
jgi:hypothetical protein